MNIAIIVAIVVGALFATAYFTRRRFGVLGLALCAGFLLSGMWTDDVTPLVKQAGIVLLTPPLSSVVAATLILLPAVLLLFSGPVYHKKWHKLFGAAAFALMATSFLLTPLGSGMNFDDTGQQVYTTLVNNRNLIITAGIAYSLFDLITYKPPKEKK